MCVVLLPDHRTIHERGDKVIHIQVILDFKMERPFVEALDLHLVTLSPKDGLAFDTFRQPCGHSLVKCSMNPTWHFQHATRLHIGTPIRQHILLILQQLLHLLHCRRWARGLSALVVGHQCTVMIPDKCRVLERELLALSSGRSERYVLFCFAKSPQAPRNRFFWTKTAFERDV